MRRRGFLVLLGAVLLAEAFIVVVIPSRIPKPVRVFTALVNLAAISALWLAGRQAGKGSDR